MSESKYTQGRPRETERPLAASMDPGCCKPDVLETCDSAVFCVVSGFSDSVQSTQLRAAMSGRWSCATLALGAREVSEEALAATPNRSEAEILQELKAGDRGSFC